MRGKILAFLAAALACACGAARADIVYNVNLSDGIETVTGTITTDGASGALTAADFVAWSFAASGTVGLSFSGPPLPAFCAPAGCGILASNAVLDFAGTGTQLLALLDGISADEIVFKPGQIIVAASDAEVATISQEGRYSIGPASAVPEPSTAILLGLGLALGLARTPARRVHCAR